MPRTLGFGLRATLGANRVMATSQTREVAHPLCSVLEIYNQVDLKGGEGKRPPVEMEEVLHYAVPRASLMARLRSE
jgi:hypothetical protein